MIYENLAVLQVVVPLLAAPATFLLHGPRLPRLFASCASLFSFAFAILLILQVGDSGEISVTLGGWVAPFGIEYRVDLFSALMLIIVSAISTIALLASKSSLERELDSDQLPLFYTAWLLCLSGLLGIVVTADAFNLFVFLEISSLSSYVLIAMGRDRRALTASFQYLVMGTIGATFILIGIGFLYMSTGTLNMTDIATRLPAAIESRTIKSAFAFLIVGIGLKMAMFPLHLWLPNAYAFAPSMVSVFLAATATKVAVYAVLRFVYSVFGYEFSFSVMPLSQVFTVLAIAAVLVASTVAIFQENLKRMLAYSSVAQIGYMLLGIGLATSGGLTAAILHIFNHALIKGALFLALGCVAWRVGSVMRNDLTGLGRRMPWTVAAFVIGGLSLIGIPMTTGFASKWLLIQAALDAGWWPVAVVVVIGSLLAVIYIWRVVEVLYKSNDSEVEVSEAPLGILLPAWALALANIYFGIFTDFSIGMASGASMWLMGAAP